MTAAVISLRERPMRAAHVKEFLVDDTCQHYDIPVWWANEDPARVDVLAATDDPVAAVLAADAFVRLEINDPLLLACGGSVQVDGPMPVELLGVPGGEVRWRTARRHGAHTVTVCRVRSRQEGQQ